jgi:feruloyl-CoA synthase
MHEQRRYVDQDPIGDLDRVRDASKSSGSVKRVILMAEPPSVDGHEITDRGYINQRATMERRKDLVEALFQNRPT